MLMLVDLNQVVLKGALVGGGTFLLCSKFIQPRGRLFGAVLGPVMCMVSSVLSFDKFTHVGINKVK